MYLCHGKLNFNRECREKSIKNSIMEVKFNSFNIQVQLTIIILLKHFNPQTLKYFAIFFKNISFNEAGQVLLFLVELILVSFFGKLAVLMVFYSEF